MMYEVRRGLAAKDFKLLTSGFLLLFSGRKGKGAGVICQFEKREFLPGYSI